MGQVRRVVGARDRLRGQPRVVGIDHPGKAVRLQLGDDVLDQLGAEQVGQLGQRALAVEQNEHATGGGRKGSAMGRGQLGRAAPCLAVHERFIHPVKQHSGSTSRRARSCGARGSHPSGQAA